MLFGGHRAHGSRKLSGVAHHDQLGETQPEGDQGFRFNALGGFVHDADAEGTVVSGIDVPEK